MLLTHGDSLSKVADDFKVIGTSNNIIVGMCLFSSVEKSKF